VASEQEAKPMTDTAAKHDIACPHCKIRYYVATSKLGRKMLCVQCGKTFYTSAFIADIDPDDLTDKVPPSWDCTPEKIDAAELEPVTVSAWLANHRKLMYAAMATLILLIGVTLAVVGPAISGQSEHLQQQAAAPAPPVCPVPERRPAPEHRPVVKHIQPTIIKTHERDGCGCPILLVGQKITLVLSTVCAQMSIEEVMHVTQDENIPPAMLLPRGTVITILERRKCLLEDNHTRYRVKAMDSQGRYLGAGWVTSLALRSQIWHWPE
jgi:predicted Zn finger-like uncharacterized protein